MIKHLREQFEAMDEDGNGVLDYAEIKAASLKVKASQNSKILKMTSKDIDQIMINLKCDKDSKINYNEFIAASINV